MSVSNETLRLLQENLGVTNVLNSSACSGGCISDGTICKTDVGDLFLKFNSKPGAKAMFEGEEASLAAIRATGTVQVPKPMKVLAVPSGGHMFVMSALDIRGLNRHAAQLGTDLARLHMHNSTLKSSADSSSVHAKGDGGCCYVEEFGFRVPTCCGFLEQDNTWTADWVEFYTQRKLQQQLNMVEKKYGDREAAELWGAVVRNIPGYFTGLEVTPALVHGDLWAGNAGETPEGPVVFDPASFYGHSEYDLAIADMFGGFPSAFWSAYFAVIPKAPGFAKRQQLYKLFHYLNHWNHFGAGYRSQSLSIMRQIAQGLDD